MISVFELFKIGIGPSSSHTVGPMRAARLFAASLDERVRRVRVTLYGSLAWTGKGHATDRAVMLGLAGLDPETMTAAEADAALTGIEGHGHLHLGGRHRIDFTPADIHFDNIAEPPRHPNTLHFAAFGETGPPLATETWCSIGGGFILPEGEVGKAPAETRAVPHDFRSGRDLLLRCAREGLAIADLVLANECALRPAAEIAGHLDRVHAAMMACIDRGLAAEGELPGGLKVKRRAGSLRRRLDTADNARAPHEVMDRISLYAIAVNEENAAGGQVVTAPTNGAAGVVPAVLRYYRDHCPGADRAGAHCFLLTAGAIGGLFKMNASISGAEVGCQGEVGVACSMAAAGLAAALGGSNEQIENAAEIAMEHHLGMTCDPIGGLVQIPCIERNAFGAVKAITAASLALRGDGTHQVSLDHVIATMRQTGADMQSKYKETSQGGLAVNLTEC